MQTIKKGVCQVTHSIGEGLSKIEQSLPRPSWSPVTDKRTSAGYGFSNAIKRNQELEHTLNNMPQGDVADTILVTTVRSKDSVF